MKLFIKLRKWMWLPTKYKLLRKKYIKEQGMRTDAEIWDKIQDIKKKQIDSERGIDMREQDKYRIILETLHWITNDSSKR